MDPARALDLSVLTPALVSEITALRPVVRTDDSQLHKPGCCAASGGAAFEASLLTMATVDACYVCGDTLDSRTRDLREGLSLLLEVTPTVTRKHSRGYAPGRVILSSMVGRIKDLPSWAPPLAPLAPPALERAEQACRDHEVWLREHGTEALARLVTARSLYGDTLELPGELERVVNLFCEGEFVPELVVDTSTGPRSALSLVDELHAAHALRMSSLPTRWLAMDRSALFPAVVAPTGRLGDAMRALMPSPSSLLLPAHLADLLVPVFGNDLRLRSGVELGPEEDLILDTLRCLMADGTPVTEALLIARAL